MAGPPPGQADLTRWRDGEGGPIVSPSLIVQAGCLMTHAVRGVLMRGKGSLMARGQAPCVGSCRFRGTSTRPLAGGLMCNCRGPVLAPARASH